MHRVEDAEVVAPEEEDAVLARELEEALHAPQRVGVGQQLAYVRNDGVHVGLQPRLELVRLDVDCAAARGGRGRRRAAVGARHTVTASPPRSQPGRRYLGWGRLRARKIAAREVHENCPSIARKFQRRNFPRHRRNFPRHRKCAKYRPFGRPMHSPPGVRLVWAGACVSAGHFAAHERELIAQRGIGQAGALTVARLPDRALAKEEAVDASNALRLRVRGGGAHSVLRCSGPSKVARRSFITTRLSCNSFLLTRCCRSSLCGVQYARMRAGPRQKYIRWVLFERIRKQSDVNTSKKTHYCTGSRAPRISELFHYSPLLC